MKQLRWVRALAVFVLAFGIFAAPAYADDSNNHQGSSQNQQGSSQDNQSGQQSNDNHSGQQSNDNHSGQTGDDNHGSGSVSDVPEVPYAAMMPVALLLAAVLIYRKRLRTE